MTRQQRSRRVSRCRSASEQGIDCLYSEQRGRRGWPTGSKQQRSENAPTHLACTPRLCSSALPADSSPAAAAYRNNVLISAASIALVCHPLVWQPCATLRTEAVHPQAFQVPCSHVSVRAWLTRLLLPCHCCWCCYLYFRQLGIRLPGDNDEKQSFREGSESSTAAC